MVELSFTDGSGCEWAVHPLVRKAAAGSAAAELRFVSRDGRVLVSRLAVAEKDSDLADWESLLSPALISRALATARFEGAFSRALRPA